MINDDENKAENKKNRSQRYKINRLRHRHGNKYAKRNVCLNIMMVICNIWNSIHENV